ncbi:MAG: CDP-alcohol phosphatidyltransferase family protein [Nannocystales bacterium]
MNAPAPRRPRGRYRFLPPPRWAAQFHAWVGRRVAVNPMVFSMIKLVVVTPLLIAALSPMDAVPSTRFVVLGLLVAFLLLDYLDAAVARHGALESKAARILDRVTDYPLLIAVAYFAVPLVDERLLVAKVALDFALLGLYVMGRGRTDNRLRAGISYAALIALLFAVQGWGGRVLNSQAIEYLLWANIAYLATTAAFYLGLLQKRFVADALSGANLLCGIFSIIFASRGRFEISLMFVLLGTAFDGFDGAAARRWGGTSIGVYSDDVADGVNYGIAPGFALYYVLGEGVSGLFVGIFYAVFVIARLVFFTLNKADSDPNYFAGVPSPVGGIVAMASIVLFEHEPGALGLMIGIACAQMVSFSTHYRHLGRAIAKHRKALVGAPLYLVVLLMGLKLGGPRGAAAVILAGNLAYGFLPMVLAFARVLSIRRSARLGLPESATDEIEAGVDDGEEPPAEDEAEAQPSGKSSLAPVAAADASS